MLRSSTCLEVVEVKRKGATELYGPFTSSEEVYRCLQRHAELDPGCIIEVRQLFLPACIVVRQRHLEVVVA